MQASVEHRFNQDWKLYAGYSYNTETFSANQLRISTLNFTTGVETRSNDGTQGSLSNASYGTSYISGRLLARQYAQRGGIRRRRPVSHHLPRQPDPAGNSRHQRLQSGLWAGRTGHDGVEQR